MIPSLGQRGQPHALLPQIVSHCITAQPTPYPPTMNCHLRTMFNMLVAFPTLIYLRNKLGANNAATFQCREVTPNLFQMLKNYDWEIGNQTHLASCRHNMDDASRCKNACKQAWQEIMQLNPGNNETLEKTYQQHI